MAIKTTTRRLIIAAVAILTILLAGAFGFVHFIMHEMVARVGPHLESFPKSKAFRNVCGFGTPFLCD